MLIFQQGRRGSILLEGLIVMTIISTMIVLIFHYIRNINEQQINKIHRERANLLIIESFEKIISARDSFLNHNKKTGWDNFITIINNTEGQKYVLSLASEDDKSIENQWELKKETQSNKSLKLFDVAPFAEYRTCIFANTTEDQEKATFDVEVRWNSEECRSGDYFYSSEQSLTLTNHSIYENLY